MFANNSYKFVMIINNLCKYLHCTKLAPSVAFILCFTKVLFKNKFTYK